MSFSAALSWTGTAFIVAGAVLIFCNIRARSPEKARLAHGIYAIGYWLGFISSVLIADPFGTALMGLLAAVFAWLWWKNRRHGRGKRALKDLGAKSRARIERLVRQMTPSPIPTPVGGKA